ncbi:hypothetical protein KSF_089310 [Reticulibacter mediterranei]|uniref:Uncharacterized protein n=1 Tax=Reticulibacter mediterranei TaxID=2778369 RepID=A0A8J3IRD4_9CHLR|nr:hypothetical protein KSF_089310 [Reticulibacter mediterranei]
MVAASQTKEPPITCTRWSLVWSTSGVDTFLVNFKMADEEGKPNRDGFPNPDIKLLDAW